ncbi:hypothetical protein DSD19_11575 [Rhodovulum sp. BSW8]|nr:hypothetical protein DSD19_11575 [Rhodovulum sp. BSW8]
MKSSDTRSRPRVPARTAATAPRHAPSPVSATAPLDTLRGLAETSAPVQRLRALGPALQREVDTSSSPFLPTYGPNETPAWKKETGIPKWALDELGGNEAVTLICSLKDGIIGSVYFPEGGRIRTTHGSGPEKEQTPERVTQQFNMDMSKARKIFKDGSPKLLASLYDKTDATKTEEERKKEAAKAWDRAFKSWLSNQLVKTPKEKLPDWIEPVTGPDSAFDPTTGAPPKDRKLFEVFTTLEGVVTGWHPSRGLAAKFQTSKKVVNVLNAAIEQIKGIKDPGERNKAFYAYIEPRIPEFAAQIRKPDQV